MKLSLVFLFSISFKICFEIGWCKFTEIGECRLIVRKHKNIWNYIDGITFVCRNESRLDKIASNDWVPCQNQEGGFQRLDDRDKINEIHFHNCEFNKIPNRIFEYFNNYTILDISNLGLEIVKPSYITSNLHVLLASHNKINEIPEHLKNGEHFNVALEKIDFSHNKIKKIDADSFKKGSQLRTFNISHNEITELDSNVFKNLSELRYLQLSSNQIQKIPLQLFTNNNKLIEIDLSENRIHLFEPDVLANNMGDLVTLDISSNEISELNKDLFKRTPNLASLNASKNNLTQIPQGFLSDAKNLTQLNLSCNEISEIGSKAIPSVQMLDLSNNHLNELNVVSFEGFDKLENLMLSHNSLSEIPPMITKTAHKLANMDLSFNKIAYFQFPAAPNLTTLNLSHNKLRTIDSNLIQTLEKLLTLDLSWNQITNLPSIIFQSLQSLVRLDLSHNPMQAVNGDLFSQLVKIRYLNLSSMSLTEIVPGTFEQQRKMEKVDLSFNRINSLNSTAFPIVNQLKLISIQNNTLQNLFGFEKYPSTTVIRIDGYICENWHNLSPQLKWYNSSIPLPCVLKSLEPMHEIIPEPIVTEKHSNHDYNLWIVIGSVIGLVVLIIIAALLVWRFYHQRKLQKRADNSDLTYIRSLASDLNYEPLVETN